MQVDTTNILFICGGAFVELDRIVERRLGEKTLGFGAEIPSRKNRRVGELLAQVQPEDLLKIGLIPELIGRLPILATLQDLNEEALIDILAKPKNALVKQMARLLEMDGVKLTLTPDALKAVAQLALGRGAGARGLRAILEQALLDVMYEVPSRQGVKECIVNDDVILRGEPPLLLYDQEHKKLA